MSLYIPKMSDTPGVTIPGLADNFISIQDNKLDKSEFENIGVRMVAKGRTSGGEKRVPMENYGVYLITVFVGASAESALGAFLAHRWSGFSTIRTILSPGWGIQVKIEDNELVISRSGFFGYSVVLLYKE